MSKVAKMDDNVSKKTVHMPNPGGRNKAGSGMDKKVTKQITSKQISHVIIAVVLVLVSVLGWQGLTQNRETLSGAKLTIAPVTEGIFEDFVPVRGMVIPAKTLYLDAIEGGRVERILVEDGASLKAGDLIVELSNATLQLNVLSNEARVAEQLNNMRSIELSLEQNRLQHKRNLVDINYQISMLTRQLEREEGLVERGALPQSQFQDTQDTLTWYHNQREITLESQASDARMQESQLAFLKETSARLENNLSISRQNLDNMNVRAPVAGKLSGFNVEVGQSIGRGERLGQIDTPNDYKVTAQIDEFYLPRVALGQSATFKQGGQTYQLEIAKIYPQVTNSQFEVDFAFVGDQPNAIRRGQNIQTRLTLGDAMQARLIPNGSFFQDTGGNWVFVVTPDGSEAVRRNVELGRRNNQYIEVLSGLEPGEQVIISPYSQFVDRTHLSIQ